MDLEGQRPGGQEQGSEEAFLGVGLAKWDMAGVCMVPTQAPACCPSK